MDEQGFRTFARVRPLNPEEKQRGGKIVVRHDEGNKQAVHHDGREEPFLVDGVLGEASTQEEVFETCIRPQLRKFISGYNCTLFTFGQTGSGKTYTVLGPPRHVSTELDEGIVQRTLDATFVLIERQERLSAGAKRYAVHVSVAEIVPSEQGEPIYDLITGAKCRIAMSRDRGSYLSGITEEPVESAQEAVEVLHRGVANRKVAETAMNRDSSRSHMIFSLSVGCTEDSDDVKRKTQAVFHMVDLAGSEDQRQTGSQGEVFKQAVGINSSLTVLGNVIRAAADAAQHPDRVKHVPYRDSKLTLLLKDSIGGNSLTTLITTLGPSAASYATSLSTLRFAERAKKIQNRATRNENTEASVGALQRQIAVKDRRIRELEFSGGGGGGGGGGGADLQAVRGLAGEVRRAQMVAAQCEARDVARAELVDRLQASNLSLGLHCRLLSAKQQQQQQQQQVQNYDEALVARIGALEKELLAPPEATRQRLLFDELSAALTVIAPTAAADDDDDDAAGLEVDLGDWARATSAGARATLADPALKAAVERVLAAVEEAEAAADGAGLKAKHATELAAAKSEAGASGAAAAAAAAAAASEAQDGLATERLRRVAAEEAEQQAVAREASLTARFEEFQQARDDAAATEGGVAAGALAAERTLAQGYKGELEETRAKMKELKEVCLRSAEEGVAAKAASAAALAEAKAACEAQERARAEAEARHAAALEGVRSGAARAQDEAAAAAKLAMEEELGAKASQYERKHSREERARKKAEFELENLQDDIETLTQENRFLFEEAERERAAAVEIKAALAAEGETRAAAEERAEAAVARAAEGEGKAVLEAELAAVQGKLAEAQETIATMVVGADEAAAEMAKMAAAALEAAADLGAAQQEQRRLAATLEEALEAAERDAAGAASMGEQLGAAEREADDARCRSAKALATLRDAAGAQSAAKQAAEAEVARVTSAHATAAAELAAERELRAAEQAAAAAAAELASSAEAAAAAKAKAVGAELEALQQQHTASHGELATELAAARAQLEEQRARAAAEAKRVVRYSEAADKAEAAMARKAAEIAQLQFASASSKALWEAEVGATAEKQAAATEALAAQLREERGRREKAEREASDVSIWRSVEAEKTRKMVAEMARRNAECDEMEEREAQASSRATTLQEQLARAEEENVRLASSTARIKYLERTKTENALLNAQVKDLELLLAQHEEDPGKKENGGVRSAQQSAALRSESLAKVRLQLQSGADAEEAQAEATKLRSHVAKLEARNREMVAAMAHSEQLAAGPGHVATAQ